MCLQTHTRRLSVDRQTPKRVAGYCQPWPAGTGPVAAGAAVPVGPGSAGAQSVGQSPAAGAEHRAGPVAVVAGPGSGAGCRCGKR